MPTTFLMGEQDASGFTPLMHAVHHASHIGIIRMLLNETDLRPNLKSGKLKNTGVCALHIAAYHGQNAAVVALIERDNVLVNATDVRTPLRQIALPIIINSCSKSHL